jgi:hypothetical protein
MITLIPINKNIQKTLHEKIGMLGRDDLTPPINETQTDEKGVAPENYMFTRVPFLRAVSFTQKKKTKNKVVILSGGKLSKHGRLRAGFSDRDVDVNTTISSDSELNEFGLYTAPNSDIVDDIPYRPIAGVKDINIDYKGGGMMLGATRTAQMSWTCWTWEELDELTPHFLTPGRTVLLEWGWSGLGKLQDTLLLPIIKPNTSEINPDELTNLQQKILQHIIDQNGHYDAMLGLVQTFDWTVRDDGGFDCSTTLVAPGVTMLQKFVKNLNSKAYSQLPGLVTQTQVKKEPWYWFNTEERWDFNKKVTPDDIAGLAPYITFKEYMANFTNQVAKFVKSKNWGEWIGSPKSRFQVIELGSIAGISPVDSVIWPFNGFGEIGHNEERAKNCHGGGYFVTWGWFEDNVLSRFFGSVTEDGKVIGEFRSFEQDVDETTGKFKVTNDEQAEPLYRATRMYNSRYLLTIDSAQWLIPNRYDPVMNMIVATGDESALTDIKNTDGLFPETVADIKSAKGKLSGTSFETQIKDVTKWNTWKARTLCRMKADKDGIAMRDIYFNVGYLQEKLKNVDDLMQGVMSVWDEFSSIYGGIYSFHVDYDDNGNRLILRERGYAGKRAFDLLSKAKSSRKDPVNLFEFPIWEKGSIVKSNSLNGKLPDRMKLAAMYGANSIKSKEEDDDGVQGTYDDLAGKAWGNLQAPKSKDGATEAEIQKDRYDDLMSGRLDFPTRGNRYFGQITGEMDKNLTVGKVVESKFIKGTNIKIKAGGPISDPNGMQIYAGIENAIKASSKEEMLRRVRQVSGKEFKETDKEGKPTAGAVKAQDLADKAKLVADSFKKFNSVTGDGGLEASKITEMYEMRLIDDTNKIPAGTVAKFVYRPALKQEYKFEMQKLLRGDDEGVMSQVDPLIPIDFEMEIDGTGGLFPGNSFQSTYLPKRYREEALLQMTKVNHKISSDGWTVTIKGQMRAVSKFDEKIAEKAAQAERDKKNQTGGSAATAGVEEKRARNLELGKTLEKKLGNMNPDNAIKLLATGFKPKTAENITKNLPSNQSNYRELYPHPDDYKEANVEFKADEAVRWNTKQKIKQDKTSIATMTFLQNQFNSGNVDWAQDASIVTQLQQTIQDLGYPNLPTWWGDGDFGPGTQRILGDFLNQHQSGDSGGSVLNMSHIQHTLYAQGG